MPPLLEGLDQVSTLAANFAAASSSEVWGEVAPGHLD
jgi:hypothetical protein